MEEVRLRIPRRGPREGRRGSPGPERKAKEVKDREVMAKSASSWAKRQLLQLL